MGAQLQQCLSSILVDPPYYACVLQSGLFAPTTCALECPDVTSPTPACCTSLNTLLNCKANAANLECKQRIDEALSTALSCNAPALSTPSIALTAVGSVGVVAALAMWILMCVGKRNAAVHSGVYTQWTRVLRMTRQLRVLIWKNFLLVKTKPFRLLFELLLPLVLASPLVVLANLDDISQVRRNRNNLPPTTALPGGLSILRPSTTVLASCSANLQFVFMDGEPSSTQTTFYASGQPVFGMFFFLSFLRFVPSVTSRMVIEKETRIAEGMRMMGMKEGPLLLSWFATGILQYSIVAVAIAVELHVGNVFAMASISSLILFFWSFILAMLSFSNLVAVFFNKSKTAAIASVLVWVLAYLPFYAVHDKPIGHKYAAALSAPTAFAIGVNYLVEDAIRGTGAFYAIAKKSLGPLTTATAGDMTWFLFADALLMLALGWYFQQIVPHEFGVQKPWYFIFQPTYWSGKPDIGRALPLADVSMLESSTSEFTKHATPMRQLPPRRDSQDLDDHQPRVEPPTQALSAKERSGDCIQICGLRKAFATEDGVAKVAVHSLNLTMYAGQITALLGHNGAGKTTTISMLTGLYPPSRGDATVFGKSIRTDMDELRGYMGVCPQHDVLYDDLTVHQHLELYATLKNVPADDVFSQVNLFIQEVGLTEKRHVMAKKLSGGQKRKLCVAIALIGHSRVVFLDEPTSGMDPYSRRFTWNVLQQNRADRVMVLTTHFMDEADLLGDRIAIMAEGRLVCAGTSLFLKNLYGAGYNLTLVKGDLCDTTDVLQFVRQFVPDAAVLSTVGSELVVQLPSLSSGAFPALLDGLDRSLTALRVLEYGISVTTLEEVFLRIAHLADNPPKNQLCRRVSEMELNEWRECRMGGKSSNSVPMDRNPVPVDEPRTPRVRQYTPFGVQFVALLQKRYRDKKGWVFTMAIPIAFLVVLAFLPAINVASYLPQYKKGSMTDHANFQSCREIVAHTTGDLLDCIYGRTPSSRQSCVTLRAPCQGGYAVRCPENGETLSSCSAARVSFNTTNASFPYCSSLPGYVGNKAVCIYDWFSHCSVTGACNATECCDAHAAASPFGPCSSCEGNRWPCFHGSCLRKADVQLQGVINTMLASLIIVIGFAFVPASVVVFIVKEKHPHQNAKYQQMACGTSVLAYWSSLWTHDVVLMLVPVAVAVGLLPLYSSFKGDVESMIAALALFGTHMLSVLPLAYLFSFRFTKHSAAQTSVLVFGLVTGALVSIVSFLCRLVNFRLTASLTLSELDATYLRWIYLVFPGYQLTDGLFQIGMRKYGNPYGGSQDTSCPASKSCWASTQDPNCCVARALEFNVAGRSLLYGAIEVVVFSLLVLYFDRHKAPDASSSLKRTPPAMELHPFDDDVAAEAARVARGDATSDSILLHKVHKQYGDEKVALQSLSLGIPKGECFGYLGINGAGKSTTMQILNGFMAATSGAVFVAGCDVRTQLQSARRAIGYCPQFDALHDTLTVEEELDLYARLKGMVDVRQAVEDKLQQFDLVAFRTKLTRGLSGGNKRKVSTAIALMGNPSVLLLDEPSTGMDPAARRRMWDVLVDVLATKTCSILLTTHSMEECQALCSRIGILVSGRLVCLGTAQHLKHKFGRGYTLDIRLRTPSTDQLVGVAPVGSDKKLTAADIERLCADAGQYARWDKIAQGADSGWVLRHYLDNDEDGAVPCDVWKHWWVLEEMGAALEAFCIQDLPSATMIEHHAEHFRYHVPKSSGHTLTSLFTLLESAAAPSSTVPIEQYSLSDTTLEEVFNGMAAGQDEEREGVHGVHRHSLNATSLQAVTSYHRAQSRSRLQD
ncbi:hypothetical protein DYB32_001770 [Aphanomyces invadans]|uniref:ABC transporter domain-containing protein n=1 Tax=Aphanomyces invadans TaxID=157072 RepID=A0A3R6Z3I0_9STRA|nr:hypothetical protein DYB32_001770 [Aphanomyces invadans]